MPETGNPAFAGMVARKEDAYNSVCYQDNHQVWAEPDRMRSKST
jgi:hypothetical protein